MIPSSLTVSSFVLFMQTSWVGFLLKISTITSQLTFYYCFLWSCKTTRFSYCGFLDKDVCLVLDRYCFVQRIVYNTKPMNFVKSIWWRMKEREFAVVQVCQELIQLMGELAFRAIKPALMSKLCHCCCREPLLSFSWKLSALVHTLPIHEIAGGNLRNWTNGQLEFEEDAKMWHSGLVLATASSACNILWTYVQSYTVLFGEMCQKRSRGIRKNRSFAFNRN